MKFLPIFFMFWLISVGVVFGQRQDSASKIFVFRQNRDLATYKGFRIFVNNIPVKHLGNGKCFTYVTKPGLMVVSTVDETGRKSELTVNLHRGETVYIEGQVFERDTTYLVHGRKEQSHSSFQLIEVTLNEAETFLNDNQHSKKSIIHMEDLIIARTNYFHVDLHLGMMIGFKQIPMFTTTNQQTVSLSPGGGSGGKIGLGYTFNRNFDITGSVEVGISTLNMPLNNASATFTRGIFEATFRYLCILKYGNRIQFGGGLTRCEAAELYVDGSRLANGARNIYKYNNTNGFHIIAGWKYLMQRWSINIDIKYTNLQYELKGATSNGYNVPVSYWKSTGVDKLDGSGLEFIFGLGYHF